MQLIKIGKLALVVVGVLALAPQVQAQATSTTAPFNIDSFSPCSGTLISLSGTLHTVFRFDFDSNGGIHVTSHQQLQNFKGYVATGLSSHQTFRIPPGPPGLPHTFVRNINLIGQGQAPNVVVQILSHVTINANGVTTASVSDFTITCH